MAYEATHMHKSKGTCLISLELKVIKHYKYPYIGSIAWASPSTAAKPAAAAAVATTAAFEAPDSGIHRYLL